MHCTVLGVAIPPRLFARRFVLLVVRPLLASVRHCRDDAGGERVTTTRCSTAAKPEIYMLRARLAKFWAIPRERFSSFHLRPRVNHPLNCLDKQWRASPSLTSPRSRRSFSLPSWSSWPAAALPPSPPPPLARVRTRRRRRRRRCCRHRHRRPSAVRGRATAPMYSARFFCPNGILYRDVSCAVTTRTRGASQVALTLSPHSNTDHTESAADNLCPPARAHESARTPVTSRFTRRLPPDSIKRAAGNIHTR